MAKSNANKEIVNGNPIFSNYRSRMIYAGIWTLITIMQTAVVYVSADLPLGYAFADTAVFGLLMVSCHIPLWYPIRFNRWEHRSWRFNLSAHLSLAFVFIPCWMLIDYWLCYLLGLSSIEYRHYLKASLWWKTLASLLLYAVAVLVYYLYIYVEQLNEKAANEIRLNQLIKDGELNLLKSQINPHFLFNSMNSVNSLILHSPEQAQKMLVSLSDYLRYSVLSTNRVYTRVEDEMENIARYLSIEKLRFGDKLIYESGIDPECFPVKIPAMLLQPLFENAIKHGVYESLDTVRVVAKIVKTGCYLNIEVSNDFDGEDGSHKKGSGTGLRNIRERLRLMYGDSAALHVKPDAGKFIVMMKIPLAVC